MFTQKQMREAERKFSRPPIEEVKVSQRLLDAALEIAEAKGEKPFTHASLRRALESRGLGEVNNEAVFQKLVSILEGRGKITALDAEENCFYVGTPVGSPNAMRMSFLDAPTVRRVPTPPPTPPSTRPPTLPPRSPTIAPATVVETSPPPTKGDDTRGASAVVAPLPVSASPSGGVPRAGSSGGGAESSGNVPSISPTNEVRTDGKCRRCKRNDVERKESKTGLCLSCNVGLSTFWRSKRGERTGQCFSEEEIQQYIRSITLRVSAKKASAVSSTGMPSAPPQPLSIGKPESAQDKVHDKDKIQELERRLELRERECNALKVRLVGDDERREKLVRLERERIPMQCEVAGLRKMFDKASERLKRLEQILTDNGRSIVAAEDEGDEATA